MTERPAFSRYRFGAFEADAASGELRRQGIRIKLNAQPFQVLLLLLERPGQLLTREQISSELWPDGTFVDYEHGVNSAVNRIREALGDTAGNPRFVETLARRGYRLVAPVERFGPSQFAQPAASVDATPATVEPVAALTPKATPSPEPAARLRDRILASPRELPKVSYRVVQTLFVLLQFMYLGFYIGALANLAEIEEILMPLPRAAQALTILIVTAAILIPVRAFVLSATLFRAPKADQKFLKLWPFLLVLDELWSLSPFLLLHHINFGLALACTTLLVYSPFAQRSLVLMGAAGSAPESLNSGAP
ncbi:MAG: winged helix-turn-helix domain-containing protein [Terracidiphilus sp.]|jgi:DNA-binding winged helix-turn-helix (wHTH) protein